MKIDMSKGYYSFQLEELDLTYNFIAAGMIQAKESYLRHISEQIDDVINSKLNKLNNIEMELLK